MMAKFVVAITIAVAVCVPPTVTAIALNQSKAAMQSQHQPPIAEPSVERQVFIVGHQIDLGAWRIIGVFDDRQVAEMHCLDDAHFVGPLTVNQAIHSATELPWPDLYYPTRKDPKGL